MLILAGYYAVDAYFAADAAFAMLLLPFLPMFRLLLLPFMLMPPCCIVLTPDCCRFAII